MALPKILLLGKTQIHLVFLSLIRTFASMKVKILFAIWIVLAFAACRNAGEHKTVICIPVYGQSLAIGVDAIRITDFDSLANYADGRIITENMDHHFGYYDINPFKQFAKKITRYQKRSYELTVYGMAEVLADNTGKDTLICIFPDGQDGTVIANLGKGSKTYNKFLHDIETAYQSAQKRGWDFVMPAFCWMQGETDVTSYPATNYRSFEVLSQQPDEVVFVLHYPAWEAAEGVSVSLDKATAGRYNAHENKKSAAREAPAPRRERSR